MLTYTDIALCAYIFQLSKNLSWQAFYILGQRGPSIMFSYLFTYHASHGGWWWPSGSGYSSPCLVTLRTNLSVAQRLENVASVCCICCIFLSAFLSASIVLFSQHDPSKIVRSVIVCKAVLWDTRCQARKRPLLHSDSRIYFCAMYHTDLPRGESVIWFSEYILVTVLIELDNWTNVEEKEKSILELLLHSGVEDVHIWCATTTIS